jgi:hypothetical protein
LALIALRIGTSASDRGARGRDFDRGRRVLPPIDAAP